jgi:hypothetical protein
VSADLSRRKETAKAATAPAITADKPAPSIGIASHRLSENFSPLAGRWQREQCR